MGEIIVVWAGPDVKLTSKIRDIWNTVRTKSRFDLINKLENKSLSLLGHIISNYSL
jgi:hypothetical protein